MRNIERVARLAPLALVAGALAVAGCGDDAGDSEPATGSPDDVVSTTLDDPGGAATIPDLPVNEDPAAVSCTAPPMGTFDATATVGGSLKDGRAAALEQGCSIRVAMRNGKGLALTEDFRPDRVNVAVESGEITEILSIG